MSEKITIYFFLTKYIFSHFLAYILASVYFLLRHMQQRYCSLSENSRKQRLKFHTDFV